MTKKTKKDKKDKKNKKDKKDTNVNLTIKTTYLLDVVELSQLPMVYSVTTSLPHFGMKDPSVYEPGPSTQSVLLLMSFIVTFGHPLEMVPEEIPSIFPIPFQQQPVL